MAGHKELSETKGAEEKVKSMVDYIRLRENPFDIDNIPNVKLHNILTKEEMDDNIRNDLLNIEKIGLELYTKLRQERFVKKEKKISDTMHRANLNNFKSIHEKKSTSAVKKNVTLKESAHAQKVIDLAPLPVEMNNVWPSNISKFKLECLVSSWVERNCGKEYPQANFVLSSFFSDDTIEQCKSLKSAHVEQSDLNSDAEEADERLIVHAMHSATHDIEKITILSNDTDVVVLFMHYWKNLKDAGLQELWIRAGLGDTTRYILIHVLAVKSPFTDIIISIHVLTGCEYTSKVGTQAAALKADIQLIKDFSTTLDLEKAEEYLVLVMKLRTGCKTMDSLRYHLYCH